MSFPAAFGPAPTSGIQGTLQSDGNVAPVALPDVYLAREDTPLVVLAGQGVLANDVDPDRDPLTAGLERLPAHGTLVLQPDGSFTYTPAPNFFGLDTFQYRATDGEAASNAASVYLLVLPVNDSPVAQDDSFQVEVNTPLRIPAQEGVLANDTDVDGPFLLARLVSKPAHGHLLLLPSGAFTYTPALDFQGTDTFTYRATDGLASSELARVTLTVGGETTPPTILAALAHDTGRDLQDGVTLDPTIQGTVIDASLLAAFLAGLDATLPSDFGDVLPDLQPDGTFTLGRARLEQLFGGPLPDGPHTLHLQSADVHGNTSDIFDVVFTLDTTPPGPPIDIHLAPATDTGASDHDGVTNVAAPIVAGEAEAGARVRLFQDSQAAGETLATGAWEFPLGLLPDGPHMLTATAEDLAGNVSDLSLALHITIDTQPPTSPAFDLAPASDAAPGGDHQTTFATVSLTGQTDPDTRVTLLEIGASTDADPTTGAFSFSGVLLALGDNPFTVRATDLAGNQGEFGRTIIRLPVSGAETDPPVVTVAVANDTGASASDQLTSDPTLTGTVSDASPLAVLLAGLDAMPVGSFVDIFGDLQPDGSYSLQRDRLEQILGGPLLDGPHALHVLATDVHGNTSSLVTFAFTLDTAPPPPPTFDLSATSDTGSPGDHETEAALVTLVGQTEAAATLLLVGPGTQALASGSGAFQLPAVQLALGANLLTLRASDRAGNTSETTQTLTRVPAAAQVDPVLEWNHVALETIRLDASPPPLATRGLAMVHAAIYDAINALDGTPSLYVVQAAPPGASPVAAVAAAGHRVLSYLYPAQQATLDAALATTLARVPDGTAEADGIALGQSIADAIIALRATDGWDAFVQFFGSDATGQWRPTPPMFDTALLPQWATLDPFTLTSPDQFRPDGPPALESQAYTDACIEVQALGRATGSTRTSEQTEIARFWADGAGTYTPPGHWNQIAETVTADHTLSLAASARLFAQLNLALADASITAWDAKYFYNFWRPITAIHDADLDGNPQTLADPAWQPLLLTPPFPEYVSGHSTYSATAAAILAATFGDNTAFTSQSFGLPGVNKPFQSFSQAAAEAGRSRIYGGIHFEFANQDGQAAGRLIAEWVLQAFKVTADTKAPTVSIESPTPGHTTKDNFTLTGRVLDNLAGVATFQSQLDDGALSPVAFDPQGRFSIPVVLPLDGTTDGPHTLRLLAVDAAGNAAPAVLFAFTLDTTAPILTIASPQDQGSLTPGALLEGVADGTGSPIVRLDYALDSGIPAPVPFDPATGAFNPFLDLSRLAVGAHSLAVTAQDAAGHVTTATLALTLSQTIPFRLIGHAPLEGAADIGVTFHPQIFFSRPVDPASLTQNNFFATGPTGEKLPATIVPADDGSFAWLFFHDPMPGAARVQVTVDGGSIRALDGTPLDGDGDGTPGGLHLIDFTTVSLTPLSGTTLSGILLDPGPDLKPMTFDDIRPGPDGALHTPDDIFLNPIVGATVFILGLEDRPVFTDAQGRFHFDAVPVGTVKVAIDGRTATNPPAGFFWPEMVMDVTLEVGRANTLMGTMGSREERRANADRPEVYLPRLRTQILQAVSGDAPVTIGVDPESAPGLTPEEQQFLSIQVDPNSLIGPDGQRLPSGQIGISTVPPELVRDMLPPGVLQHTFDITLQAPGIDRFATPAPMTFPNLFNAAPGTQLNFLSFDHTTGRLVIEGTATVSADGLSVTTDPGSGITHPGWHGVTPPGSCGGSGAPPIAGSGTPQSASPFAELAAATPTVAAPPQLFFHIGPDGTVNNRADGFGGIVWMAPPGPSPLSGPGCAIPQPQDDDSYVKVKIEIDGPLATIAGSLGDVPLSGTTEFVLRAGTAETRTLDFRMLTYDEMFGPGEFANLTRDHLYGSRLKILTERFEGGEQQSSTEQTLYFYRMVTVENAGLRLVDELPDGLNEFAFQKTFNDGPGGIERTKTLDFNLPDSFETVIKLQDEPDKVDFKNVDGAYHGLAAVQWTFDPQLLPLEIDVSRVRLELTVDGQSFSTDFLVSGSRSRGETLVLHRTEFVSTMAETLRQLRLIVESGDGGPGVAGVDDDGNGTIDDDSEWGLPDFVSTNDRIKSHVSLPIGSAFRPFTLPALSGFGRELHVLTDIQALEDLGGDNDRIDMEFGFSEFLADSLRYSTADELFSNLATNSAALADDLYRDLKFAVEQEFSSLNQRSPATPVFTIVDEPSGVPTDFGIEWKVVDEVRGSRSPLGEAFANFPRGPLETVLRSTEIGETARQFMFVELSNPVPSTAAAFNSLPDRRMPPPVAIYLGKHIEAVDTAISFAEVIGETVAHEAAHFFGVRDAYVEHGTPPNESVTDLLPFDIMSSEGLGLRDVQFQTFHVDHLAAAVGVHQPDLRGALLLFREHFRAPGDPPGLDVPLPVESRTPELLVDQNGATRPPGEQVVAQPTTGDGPGGRASAIELRLVNPHFDTLVISTVHLSDGATGFRLVNDLSDVTLTPGQSAVLQVEFDPGSGIDQALDTLIIESNASIDPVYKLELVGPVLPAAPTIQAKLIGNNNLGGARVAGGVVSRPRVFEITNRGAGDLIVSGVRLVDPDGVFELLGVPADLQTNPLALATGLLFTFGVSFDPDSVGLARAIIEVQANDPTNPRIRLAATGTGVDDPANAAWGNDFVAFESSELPGSFPLRAVSDDGGHFEFFLPAAQQFHLAVFDPVTGLVAHRHGMTPLPGQGFDLTGALVFAASEMPDADFDGLPDDVEFAIGTSPKKADTDGNGLDDFIEIQQGLDPLGGRAFPTGVIAALRLNGDANDVVVDGSTAYVATSGGLAIVDVSQFTRPIILGEINLPAPAVEVAFDPLTRFAAVVTADGNAHFIDAANPTNPALRSSLALGNASAIETFEGVAYIVTATALVSHDLLTGEQLQFLSVPGLSGRDAVARDGSTLYLARMTAFSAIDISAQENAVLLDSVLLPDVRADQVHLSVGNGLAVLLYTDTISNVPVTGSVSTIDVSDPVSMQVIVEPVTNNAVTSQALARNGSGLVAVASLLQAGNPGLSFFADTDATAPLQEFLFAIDTPGDGRGLAIASGVALVADGAAGLQIVNYLPFDIGGQPPVVTVRTTAEDIDTASPGIQVLEGSSVTLIPQVSDDLQVQRVELLRDGEVVASDVSFPWDLSAFALSDAPAPSAIAFRVRAIDTGGNAALSDPIVINAVPDTFAPSVVTVTPAEGATGLEGLRRVTIRFSEPVAASTVRADTLRLLDSAGNLVPVRSIQLRDDDQFVQLAFDPLLSGSYRLVVSGALTDRAGNALAGGEFTSSFTLAPLDDRGPLFPRKSYVAGSNVGVLDGIGSGDFNRDGHVDVVGMGFDSSNNFFARLFLSTDSFDLEDAGRIDLPSMGILRAVTVVDLNHDGFDDIVFGGRDVFILGTPQLPALVVLVSKGDGTFAAPVKVSVDDFGFSGQIFLLSAGDVTGDGHVDVVAFGFGLPLTDGGFGSQPGVFVLPGNGNGGFDDAIAVGGVASGGFGDLVLSDFNRDSRLDICFAGPSSFSVMLNNGDGTFSRADTPVPVGADYTKVAFGDVNEDGLTDLVAANRGTSPARVEVFFASGDGRFATGPVHVPIASFFRGDLTLADMNNDDHLDAILNTTPLVVGMPLATTILLGAGDGTFNRQLDSPQNVGGIVHLSEDFDGNGNVDLLMTGGINLGTSTVTFTLVRGNGDGTLDSGSFYAASAPSRSVPSDFVLADVNGDGILDAITVSAMDGSFEVDPVVVLLGLPGGIFRPGAAYITTDTNLMDTLNVQVGDLDGDDDPDILTGRAVLLNNGDGTFGAPFALTLPTGQNLPITTGTRFRLFDAEGDSDLDIIATNSGDSLAFGLQVFLNNGSGSFVAGSVATFSANRTVSNAFDLGDVNGDNLTDAIMVDELTDEVVVGFGRLDGTLRPTFGNFQRLALRDTTALIGSSVFKLGDLDGDGDLDILTGAFDVVPSEQPRRDRIITFTNEGTGQFGDRTMIPLGPQVITPLLIQDLLTLNDVNLDGNNDILLLGTEATVLLLGLGDGTFGEPELFGQTTMRSAVLGDVDGDGDPDLVHVNGFGAGLLVSRNRFNEPAPVDDREPPIITATLFNDTGENQRDQITSDPAITGSIADLSITAFRAGFKATPSNVFFDATDFLQGNGNFFMLDRARLEQINGGSLSDGVHTLHLIATDAGDNTSALFDLTFTLDTTPPVTVFDLDPGSDSPPVGDHRTTLATVTLRGTTEADAFVDLSPTFQSVRSNATGVFVFENVTLLTGPNLFTVQVTDQAGNTSESSTEIILEAAEPLSSVSSIAGLLPGENVSFEQEALDVTASAGPAAGFIEAEAMERTAALTIPTDLAGQPGSTITVPVRIDNAAGLEALDLQPAYDTALLNVAPGENRILGGSGDDLLQGEKGKNKLGAGPRHDELLGGPGHDIRIDWSRPSGVRRHGSDARGWAGSRWLKSFVLDLAEEDPNLAIQVVLADHDLAYAPANGIGHVPRRNR